MSLGHTEGTANPTAKKTGEICPMREVLARVGDKWTVMVVRNLRDEPKRFSALRRDIDGISQRMLTRTLRGLERDGLVTRTVHPTVPPQVEYDLTRLGRTLLDPILALATWAYQNRAAVQTARTEYDAEQIVGAEPT